MPRHHRKSERAEKAKSRSSKSSRSRSSKAAEIEASPPKERKSRSSKSKSSKKTRKEEVVETVPETVPEVTESVPDTPVSESTATPKRKRTTPTKESVMAEFEELTKMIEDEIENLRNSSGKTKGIKFLRSVRKNVNTLCSHTARVMKKRSHTKRQNNSNSGFLKPVRISKEMAKFTGWDPEEKKSRVDVTKYICNYISEHNLQNPTDRRQIRVEDDRKLRKLLGYDPKKDEKPLTYYSLQTYMKKHFIKDEQK